jgi:hypothetical protein
MICTVSEYIFIKINYEKMFIHIVHNLYVLDISYIMFKAYTINKITSNQLSQ